MSTIMDIQSFIKKFAEAIEVEDVDALTPETEFHDLDEWSSLSVIIAAVAAAALAAVLFPLPEEKEDDA